MNDNKQATSVTVRTVHQSDFSVPAGQTDLGENGVVVNRRNARFFVPYSNVSYIEYELEEVEDEESSEEEDTSEVAKEKSTEEESTTVTESFAQSVMEDTLEQDYTVSELSDVLPEIDDTEVINNATMTDGRSTAVDEYEDRLEDLRDEGQ